MLWGFCNGMIDVMDKHFQKELNLTLAQSIWVQFAHYFGYFLMAMPAGWLAAKFGYKGGIIAGLLLVSVGGFWFIPATQIATFPSFLYGVCLIAFNTKSVSPSPFRRAAKARTRKRVRGNERKEDAGPPLSQGWPAPRQQDQPPRP